MGEGFADVQNSTVTGMFRRGPLGPVPTRVVGLARKSLRGPGMQRELISRNLDGF